MGKHILEPQGGDKRTKSTGCFVFGKRDACRSGASEELLKLIAEGVDVNQVDHKQNTPLTLACYEGLFKVALALINQGANVNHINSMQDTPLTLTCWSGLSEVSIKLIEKGADVNHVDKYRNTPLIWACYRGLSEVALKLIEKGANVNHVNDYQSTPLSLACKQGLSEVAQRLVEKGANVNHAALQHVLSKELYQVGYEVFVNRRIGIPPSLRGPDVRPFLLRVFRQKCINEALLLLCGRKYTSTATIINSLPELCFNHIIKYVVDSYETDVDDFLALN